MSDRNWVEIEPQQLEKLAGPFEWKVVEYANRAAYADGLAAEVAADWEPHFGFQWNNGLANVLVVTYRRIPVQA